MKRLIFRLSSLGDVILSQSVLEPPFEGDTHWVIAKEYEALLLQNPRLSQVWSYDRKQNRGIAGWFRLLRILANENYTEVLDLHCTLRTLIARIYFRTCSPETRWKKISKERWRRTGYILLKRAWPSMWRPRHLARRCAILANGSGGEKPNLRWMLVASGKQASQSPSAARIAIAPSSAWQGKEWKTAHYVSWIRLFLSQNKASHILLLGTPKDRAANELRDSLSAAGIPFQDGIGKFTLREIAQELSTCSVTIGADTGLLHLSESVGTPVLTLFGPTRSDFGFGPLLRDSIPLDSPLWCSPCSKDGTLCFRIKHRYRCLDEVSVERLERVTGEFFSQVKTSQVDLRDPPIRDIE